MPLTHVTMWNKGKWEPISIEKARQIHPIGRVSASSKLFMCDLCYQPVTLTEKNIRESYFKHSRSEDDKNCPERTFGSSNWIAKYATLQLKTKGLPIKIVVQNKSFHFELGFPALKEFTLDPSSIVTIITDMNSYKYAAERFESEGTSFMNVGNIPSKSYKILISRENNKQLRQYWPTEVTGFTGSRLFKISTGIMLTPTSDISSESDYYLLSKNNYSLSNRFMNIRKVCTKNKYSLYIIKPKNLEPDTAKFFLEEFRLRLTSEPIRMTYLWPAVIQNQYMTYHNKQWLYVHVYGDASVMLFPTGMLEKAKLQSGQLLKIKLNDRQQMLSIGRNVNILDYSYFWHSDLDYSYDYFPTKAVATSEFKDPVQIKDRKIILNTVFDGQLLLEKDGWIESCYELKACEHYEFEYNPNRYKYKLLQGMDRVWESEDYLLKHKADSTEVSDRELLRMLQKCHGKKLPAGSNVINMARSMHSFPISKAWVARIIREGYIKSDELELLKTYFR